MVACMPENVWYPDTLVPVGGVFLKIHILCDLHVEFGNFVPPVVGADVVVLAGDVHVKNRGLQWIFDQKFEIPVLYVLGNHEFYREKFPGLIDKLKMGAEGTNVHVPRKRLRRDRWVSGSLVVRFGQIWSCSVTSTPHRSPLLMP